MMLGKHNLTGGDLHMYDGGVAIFENLEHYHWPNDDEPHVQKYNIHGQKKEEQKSLFLKGYSMPLLNTDNNELPH